MLIYIHFPFCRRRCLYCAFHSSAIGRTPVPSAYIPALLREIRWWAGRLETRGSNTVSSVYFGGGTPSLMSPDDVGTVLDTIARLFRMTDNVEVTLEGNPESLKRPGAVRGFRDAGVTRLSVGVQSMITPELKTLGRIHSVKDVQQTFEEAHRAGYQSLSADLMWGLPGQTLHTWLESLEAVMHLGPDHVSAYGLSLEEDAPFLSMFRDGCFTLPDDEEQREMYLRGTDFLEEHAFSQYEISNYARFGHACRHNCGYWQGQEFLGMGPSAVSTMGGKRWTDAPDFGVWLENTSKGTLGGDPEILSPLSRLLEFIMLRLRTVRGLSYQEYTFRTGRFFREDYGDYLKALTKQDLVIATMEGCRLTQQGMLVSNAIITGFFDLAERIFGKAPGTGKN